MASILADKDVDAMLAALAAARARFVASPLVESALASGRGARRARAGPYSTSSRPCDHPRDALELAHALGEPVLVTGSLYLLADLEAGR